MSRVNLREAHEFATANVFDDDHGNAAYWYLTCAAESIRRSEQHVPIAEVVEACQRYLADEENIVDDRHIVMFLVDYYDWQIEEAAA